MILLVLVFARQGPPGRNVLNTRPVKWRSSALSRICRPVDTLFSRFCSIQVVVPLVRMSATVAHPIAVAGAVPQATSSSAVTVASGPLIAGPAASVSNASLHTHGSTLYPQRKFVAPKEPAPDTSRGLTAQDTDIVVSDGDHGMRLAQMRVLQQLNCWSRSS